MKKAIVYCRVSSKKQANEGYSLADQESRIMKYIEAKKKKEDDFVIQIMIDDGFSASSLDRPKMKKIIEMIENKEIDSIYVYCLDRLTRKITDLAYLIDLMNKNDVTLISLCENVETKTPAGKLFINIVVLFAQWELENILSRTSRGIMESAAQGNYPKAVAPFGYVKKDGKLVIYEEKAELVRYVFNAVAVDKRSVNSVRIELSKNRNFNLKWSNTSLYRMIRNEIYIGTFVYGGFRIENHSPAIIEKEIYHEANRLIRKYEESQNKYIFKKFAYCSECGEYAVTSMTTKPNGKSYKYYKCSCCGKEIGEIKILSQCKNQLDDMASTYFNQLDLEEVEKQYEQEFGKLKSIIASVGGTNLTYDQVKELTGSLIDRVDNLEGEIGALQAGVENREFCNVEFHVQRDILIKYVEKIKIDMRSKRADIIFKKQ